MVTNNLLTFVDIAGVMGRLRGAPSMAGWSCPTWNRLPRPPHRRRPGQRPTWKPLWRQKYIRRGRGIVDGHVRMAWWIPPIRMDAARDFNSPTIPLMLRTRIIEKRTTTRKNNEALNISHQLDSESLQIMPFSDLANY